MRLHHRFPPWAMLLLLGPLLYIVASVAHRPFMAIATGGLPAYVLKGKLFTERFNTIHAGCSMDQPTIGKWLIWFLVLTVLSVPLIALTRWLGDRSSQLGYWAFGVPVLAIGGLLLSVLILPLCMLVQYVYWMGFTPKRVFGLVLCITVLVLFPLFLRWAIRLPASSSGEDTKQPRTQL